MTEYESTNALRLATGIFAGAALALLLAVFILAFKEGPTTKTPSSKEEDAPIPLRESVDEQTD